MRHESLRLAGTSLINKTVHTAIVRLTCKTFEYAVDRHIMVQPSLMSETVKSLFGIPRFESESPFFFHSICIQQTPSSFV